MEPDNKNDQKELKSFFTNDKVRYTFYFDLSPDRTPEKVEVYLEARTLTEDALIEAIDQINQTLRKSDIQLIREVSLYKVRLVGRNFKPKTDMPCLSLYQKICDLKIEEIAVQIPNREKAIRHLVKAEVGESKSETKDLIEKTEALHLTEKHEGSVHGEQA